MSAPIPLTDLAEIHKISDGKLSKWRREGTDVYDTREVVSRIWKLRRRPPEWIEVFNRLTKADDAGTHEALKRQKTAGEVERLRLVNERLAGESFPRAEGEAVMASWIAALNVGLLELQSQMPPQLEGLSAAKIDEFLGEAFHKFRTDLSDLSSDLWDRVYQNATPETSPPSPTKPS
jgi:hypothetical protein